MAQVHAIINFLVGLWPMVRLCLDIIGYFLTAWVIIKFIRTVVLFSRSMLLAVRDFLSSLVEKLLLAPLERFVGQLAWLLLLTASVVVVKAMMPKKYW